MFFKFTAITVYLCSLQIGNTPLHIACEVNNGELVRSLLEVMHRRRLCTPYLVNHVSAFLSVLCIR